MLRADSIHFRISWRRTVSLVPVGQMRKVYDACDGLWDHMTWGATTNLVFKLKDEHKEFIKGPLGKSTGNILGS